MGISHQIKYAERKSKRTALPPATEVVAPRSAPMGSKRVSSRKSSEPASPAVKGRGRPVGSPYSGRVGVLIKFDPEAVAWMDGEFVRRKMASRVDLIRALVDEAKDPK